MKQMGSRGKFFLGGSKLRKFGLDESRFYFYDGVRPDFPYGPGPLPYGPPPPPGPPGDFYPLGPPPPPHPPHFGMSGE